MSRFELYTKNPDDFGWLETKHTYNQKIASNYNTVCYTNFIPAIPYFYSVIFTTNVNRSEYYELVRTRIKELY